MRVTQLIAVLVALSLVVGSLPAAAVATTATTGSVQTQLQENSTETNQSESIRASTGQQLATVLAVTDDEVTSAVEESSTEASFAAAAETERAELIASRASTLQERAEGLVDERRSATAAYENGTLSNADYAQRVAVLSGRASTVSAAIDRLQRRAETVSTGELEAAGYDAAALADTENQLESLTGSSSRALLEQYTGISNGQFSVDRANGVEIEVESEDGEQARSFERPQPGNGSFVVSMSDAQTTAEAALSTDHDGEWTLDEAKRKTEYGFYEFEFVFEGPTHTGEAEVDVDGQTGEIFEFEEELEPRDDEERDDDEREDEAEREEDDREDDEDEDEEAERDDENGTDDGELSVNVVSGDPAPSATVTIEVTQDGTSVPNASVTVNDELAGSTDENGQLTVTLPDDEDVEIAVESGDSDGEREFEFDTDDDSEESEDTDDEETDDDDQENQ